MKRKITWILVAIALLITVGGVVSLQNDGGHTIIARRHTMPKALHPKKACELLTLQEARSILGLDAYRVPSSGTDPASTDNIQLSSCAYETTNGDTTKSTSLTARAALHDVAYGTNVLGFRSTHAAAVQGGGIESVPSVHAMRTLAYYDTSSKQLHMLVQHGRYWIIIQYDGGSKAAETIAQYVLTRL